MVSKSIRKPLALGGYCPVSYSGISTSPPNPHHSALIWSPQIQIFLAKKCVWFAMPVSSNELLRVDMNSHSDPLQPHSHDPNPEPPSPDPNFVIALPDGIQRKITVEHLYALPAYSLPECYIVSTGHGTTGPFTFSGPTLLSIIQACTTETDWHIVEVISGDGFGTRVTAKELHTPTEAGPMILAYAMDGQPMEREEGLLRLIVPSETDDALRQVKWVQQVRIVPKAPINLWSRYFVDQSRLHRAIVILLATAIAASVITLIMTFLSAT